MPSARVFGPWPEHSNPAASCLQWSCALQAEAVDTFFFFACAHLTRERCCTSDLIAPIVEPLYGAGLSIRHMVYLQEQCFQQCCAAQDGVQTPSFRVEPDFEWARRRYSSQLCVRCGQVARSPARR